MNDKATPRRSCTIDPHNWRPERLQQNPSADRIIRSPHREDEQRWKHGEAERFGRSGIDDQVESGRRWMERPEGLAPLKMRSTYSAKSLK